MSDAEIMEWANENLGAIRIAVGRTVFGKLKEGTQREWTLDLTKTNELPRSEEDEPATTDNSVALICWESIKGKYIVMRAQSKG